MLLKQLLLLGYWDKIPLWSSEKWTHTNVQADRYIGINIYFLV